MSRLLFPHLSINPDYLTLYYVGGNNSRSSIKFEENKANLKRNKPEGVISEKAKKRINKSISWLLLSATNKKVYQKNTGKYFNFKMAFVTLTLASKQIHSDNEIKSQLLNQFLIEAKKKWKVSNYIWRAEAQKNGNIHFHLIVDKFIPYWELKKTWNRIQNKLGYVDRFCEKNKSTDPNSTDIHSIKKIKNIKAYFSKYFSKNTNTRTIEGKLWGLSTSLSQMKSLVIPVCDEIFLELRRIHHNFNKFIKSDQFYTCYFVKFETWHSKIKGHLYDLFLNHLSKLNSNSSDNQLFTV